MRLDKFICKSTELSLVDAIQSIHSGQVCVNSEAVVDESIQVHENNTVTLAGQKLTLRPFRYILLHKPTATICSNVDGDYPSVFNYLDIENASELHIAGRLDVDTTGLVLITDDGRWTYNITRPDKACKKTYRVGLSYGIAAAKQKMLEDSFSQGIQLQGEQQLTLPATLKILAPRSGDELTGSKDVLLTITEGRYHQVKRRFAAVGNRVLALHREQIGAIKLDVEIGQWRYLTQEEISSFNSVG